MHYKLFGLCSGLRASESILGTGNFGTGWGQRESPPKPAYFRLICCGGRQLYRYGRCPSTVRFDIGSDDTQSGRKIMNKVEEHAATVRDRKICPDVGGRRFATPTGNLAG